MDICNIVIQYKKWTIEQTIFDISTIEVDCSSRHTLFTHIGDIESGLDHHREDKVCEVISQEPYVQSFSSFYCSALLHLSTFHQQLFVRGSRPFVLSETHDTGVKGHWLIVCIIIGRVHQQIDCNGKGNTNKKYLYSLHYSNIEDALATGILNRKNAETLLTCLKNDFLWESHKPGHWLL